MARKREIIGYLVCPLCGDGFEMEVRRDKNGHPYAWCPECTVQILTHGGLRAQRMEARMRPAAHQGVEEQEAGASEAPEAPRQRPERAEAGGGWGW